MKCPTCGNIVDPMQKFCTKCGTKIVAKESTPEESYSERSFWDNVRQPVLPKRPEYTERSISPSRENDFSERREDYGIKMTSAPQQVQPQQDCDQISKQETTSSLQENVENLKRKGNETEMIMNRMHFHYIHSDNVPALSNKRDVVTGSDAQAKLAEYKRIVEVKFLYRVKQGMVYTGVIMNKRKDHVDLIRTPLTIKDKVFFGDDDIKLHSKHDNQDYELWFYQLKGCQMPKKSQWIEIGQLNENREYTDGELTSVLTLYRIMFEIFDEIKDSSSVPSGTINSYFNKYKKLSYEYEKRRYINTVKDIYHYAPSMYDVVYHVDEEKVNQELATLAHFKPAEKYSESISGTKAMSTFRYIWGLNCNEFGEYRGIEPPVFHKFRSLDNVNAEADVYRLLREREELRERSLMGEMEKMLSAMHGVDRQSTDISAVAASAEKVSARTCPACGAQVPDGEIFCPECGQQIERR